MRSSQVLLADWAVRQAGVMSASDVEDQVAALDAVLESSMALSGALAVEFRPACLADALGEIHEHVLCRIKECVADS